MGKFHFLCKSESELELESRRMKNSESASAAQLGTNLSLFIITPADQHLLLQVLGTPKEIRDQAGHSA